MNPPNDADIFLDPVIPEELIDLIQHHVSRSVTGCIEVDPERESFKILWGLLALKRSDLAQYNRYISQFDIAYVVQHSHIFSKVMLDESSLLEDFYAVWIISTDLLARQQLGEIDTSSLPRFTPGQSWLNPDPHAYIDHLGAIVTERRILSSAAGFYVGRYSKDSDGIHPYSRESEEYFETYTEAVVALEENSFTLRLYP